MTTREQDSRIEAIASLYGRAEVTPFGPKDAEGEGAVLVTVEDASGRQTLAEALDVDGQEMPGAITKCYGCSRMVLVAQVACEGCHADAVREIERERAE